MDIVRLLYNSYFISSIFHTLPYCLQKELRNCNSVLDLGCGSLSPIKYCKNIQYSVGVDAHKPYIEESKKKSLHTKYINKDIEDIDFPANSFDAVILIEVLEHLPIKTGILILRKVEKWARKKIIVTSPNGFVPQNDIDGNPYQKHISGWDLDMMKGLGFKCYGLAGLKYLRKERQHDTKEATVMSSIRYRPRSLWFIIASLSQIIIYHIPSLAFEIFSVKKLSKKVD